MKIAKKVFVSLLAFCMALPLLAGCNREPAMSKETVRIIAHTEQEAVLEPFFDKFMEDNPDITVEVLYGVGQNQQLETEFPPDLLFVSNLTAVNYKDIMFDIEELLQESEEGQAILDDMIVNTLDMMRVDGTLLALPIHANVSLLYYNEKIFDDSADQLRSALGLSADESVYPQEDWTWDDFTAAGKALFEEDDRGVVSQWGCTTVNTWWGEWLTYVRQLGGDFMDNEGNLMMKTHAFKQGMEFFKNKCYGPNAFAYNPTSTETGRGSLGGFVGRRTAMEFGGHTGSWVSYNEIKGFDWNVQMLPTPVGKPDARGAEVAVEGYGIYTGALNKEKALRVLLYMFSEEGQAAFSQLSKLIPTHSYKELVLSVPYEDRPQPKNMEAVFQTMEEGVSLPTHPGFEQGASTHMTADINKYISNQYTTVDEFVNNATVTVQNYLNSLK